MSKIDVYAYFLSNMSIIFKKIIRYGNIIQKKHFCFKCQQRILWLNSRQRRNYDTCQKDFAKIKSIEMKNIVPEEMWKMKENSFEVSNMYFGFISILFLILSLFVLYVIFLLPFYTFFTLFLPLGAWCIMVLLVAFVIFITCFVTIVTKEYPAETHVWQKTF